MREAAFYRKSKGNSVDCFLCSRRCHIPEGATGTCRVRKNIGGKLYAMTYAKPVSISLDPIEKKPLFHFLPGTKSLSLATVGCNFRCLFCQNWEISQASWDKGPQEEVPPEEIARLARERGAPSISFTYNEPTVFYEYARDIAALAHESGIKTTYITNGYMTKEMLADFRELDAANVDIKGNEKFYRDVCGGVEMEHVLETIKTMRKKKIWVEATNLIIPGYNDDDGSIRQISEFCRDTDPDMPLHFTAFYPQYKMLDTPPTPREALVRARKIALDEGVKYSYCGNTYPGDPYENTYCPNCGALLVERHGFSLVKNNIKNGRCPECGAKIAGLFS